MPLKEELKQLYLNSDDLSLQLVQWHGLEADRHFLRCLISCVDFSKGELSESSAKDYYQAKLLKQKCNSLLSKPSFISNLCFAVDNPLHHQKVFVHDYILLLQMHFMRQEY